MKRKVILSILSLLALSACNGANESPFDNYYSDSQEVIQLSDIEYTLYKRKSDNKNALRIDKYKGNYNVDTGYYERKYNIEIPSSFKIDGSEYLVTSIGDKAFYGQGLESVKIPNSIIEIGQGAFAYNNLTSVYIPSSGTMISNNAFVSNSDRLVIYCEAAPFDKFDSAGCLDSVTYWGVKKEDIIIQDGVVYLIVNDWMAIVTQFIGSSDAKNISIQSKITRKRHKYRVTSIENKAFYGCYSLTNIVIPNNVINIGERAFSGCKSLTSIVIPDSVLSIRDKAFYGIQANFYCEAVAQPAGWDYNWNSDQFVYWKGEWSYVDAVPTPNKN